MRRYIVLLARNNNTFKIQIKSLDIIIWVQARNAVKYSNRVNSCKLLYVTALTHTYSVYSVSLASHISLIKELISEKKKSYICVSSQHKRI